MHRTLLLVLLCGCGGREPAPASPSPPPVEAKAEPAAPASTAEAKPEGPPFVVERLTVAMNKKALDLAWDVTRKTEVAAGTILFVQSVCKVGYTTKTEDETVSGVDAIAVGAPRAFKLPAFASVGLALEPTWCTFHFSYGPKGSASPEKLASFCWKQGSVTDGPCA